jgi:hypothetical protein
MNGYTTIPGQDQNGQTISKYTNNQQKCKSECDSNPKCKGMVTNANNCWTIKDFPSQYSKSGSITYKKIVYPIPTVISNNFPTSPNNNLFSSVFCNVSTNNGFIQKENSTFNNLPIYNTQNTPDENTCLNNCKNDDYCSSYSFQKNNSSSNCLLYNQVPTSISNNDININIGYKNTYNYNFDNLNSSQKNVIRNDCINYYLNNNYNTTNLNYTNCYSLGNNNSQLNFNPSCLANMYTPLGKVNTINNFTNINTDIINSITNEKLNDFINNYTGYQQTQIGILNSSNEKNSSNSYYTQEINNNTNIESTNAKNNLLQDKKINTDLINQSINGSENNIITESFENNINKSNTINFYFYIFIVLIFLYILYYLKKNKYFK